MKHLFIVILFILFYIRGYSQNIKEIKEKNLINTLGQIDTAIFRKASGMVISVYRLSNGPGSANLSESDEVSYNLLISISQYDEYPENKLFSIGPFISPVISNEKDLTDEYVFSIKHGLYNMRKVNKVHISSGKVLYR